MGFLAAIGWFVAMWVGHQVGRLDMILVAFSLVICGAIWLLRRTDFARWFCFRGRALLEGALVGLFLVVAAHFVYPFLPRWFPFVETGVQQALHSLSTDSAWATLPLIAFTEEILFRGLLLDEMIEKWGARIAYPVSVLFYAGAQSGAGIALLPGLAFGFGAVFAFERYRTRGLWAPLVTHLIWTPSVVVFFPIAGR